MQTLAQLMFLTMLFTVFLTACANDGTVGETAVPTDPTATPMPTSTPERPFRVIAYLTSAIVPATIPYERLTHINYAFLIPNEDGSFAPFSNGWKLKQIASEAHQAGVKVLISVGGWGWDAQFETLAADPALRASFVQNLSAFVDEYGLDGADIDWEYPDPGQSAENFLALIQELRAAMPNKLLTTAVVSYGETAEGVESETFDLFDFVNIMTYDGPDHGTMEQFNTGLDYWQGRGLPAEKMVMGVPFYSRPNEVIYRNIVETDPQAAYTDSIEYNGTTNFYNGIPTIQNKTRIAMERAGGIMFWTLDQDTTDDLSLLNAIDSVVHP
ncbi:MAG: glycosyl hydrolase family 18 protein [Candidatus Promineifilaceae bacterium]